MKGCVLTSVVAVAFLAACSTPNQEDSGASSSAPAPSPPVAVAPMGPTPDSTEYFQSVVGNTVQFDFDEYDLQRSAQATLRGQATWLNQNPARTIVVEGHCDERGTREYNLGLGERRANAVKEYLVSLGVAASRIRTLSYGKERPTCVASSESCWSKNRRGVSLVQGAGV